MPQPEQRIKVGPCVASIFANEIESRTGKAIVRRVTLSRLYRDTGGGFKHTTTLRPGDIPNAVLALNRAYEYVATKTAASS